MATNEYQANIGVENTSFAKSITDPLAQRGCIIRSVNHLGDAVMTLPAVYKIKEALPKQAPLVILCRKNLASFWQSFEWVDRVISMEGKHVKRRENEAIRQANAGFAVILPNSFGSAMDLFMKDIPLIIARSGRCRGLMIHRKLPSWKRIPGQDTHHQLREYLELAYAAGGRGWNAEFPPAQPKVDLNKLKTMGYQLSANLWLSLAPGAAFGPAKQWPVNHFAEVAKWWLDEGGKVAILGAPGEEDVCAELATLAPGSNNFCGKTNIPELMHILFEAKFCVVNDSGAMHLAASVQSDGVAIFGSTVPVATGPLGGRWKIMWPNPDCSPCLQKECPLSENRYHCLTSISPKMVIEELKSLN